MPKLPDRVMHARLKRNLNTPKDQTANSIDATGISAMESLKEHNANKDPLSASHNFQTTTFKNLASTFRTRPSTTSKWTTSLNYKLRNSHDTRRDNLMKLFKQYKSEQRPQQSPPIKIGLSNTSHGSPDPPADQIGNTNYFMNRVESLDEPILEEKHEDHQAVDRQPGQKWSKQP